MILGCSSLELYEETLNVQFSCLQAKQVNIKQTHKKE